MKPGCGLRNVPKSATNQTCPSIASLGATSTKHAACFGGDDVDVVPDNEQSELALNLKSKSAVGEDRYPETQ